MRIPTSDPIFEIAGPDRSDPTGAWRIRFAVYRKPLRVFGFGRWLIGRPW